MALPPSPPPEVPIQLRLTTLGTLDLRPNGGEPIRTVLGSPKRTALLLALACRRSDRFLPRDNLLALLWPDFDDERARNSLRTTLYALRSALGPGVVIARPDGSLGVDEHALWCDALAFDAAVDAQRWAEAVELYRGDFLDGRPVLGLPEFEGWVETERARLRRRAIQALWHLSELLESAGEIVEAIALGRRTLTLAPANELALRRLVSLQYRSGDRSGALESFNAFAQELQERFEVRPSDETEALMELIRRGKPIPGAPLAPEVLSDPAAWVRAPAPDGPSAPTPRAEPGRTPVSSSISAWSVRVPLDADGGASPLVMVPFTWAGPPGEAWLVQALQHALMASLDRLGRPGVLERPGTDATSPPSAGWERIEGAVVGSAGRLRVTAWRVGPNGAPPARSTVEGPMARLLELCDALAERLLASGESAELAGAAGSPSPTP